MDLGVRQIRTAGKGSGSIELTLPAELRDLVGLPCRVTLRDGSRPDIVLQPDLRRAHAAFAALWRAMASALLNQDADAAALAFPVTAFGFGLQPRPGGGAPPFLCWRDGLALAASPPHEPEAVARVLAAFGHAIAGTLRIAPSLAAGFGAACGAFLVGIPAASDAQEACDLAAAALRPCAAAREPRGQAPPGAVAPCGATPLAAAGAEGVQADAFWRHAGPVLAAVAEVFLGWTADPAGHAALRAAWHGGRAIEMSGG